MNRWKPKITVQKAYEINDRDNVLQCLSCSDMAEDNKTYCRQCGAYWKDVDEGLFDYDLEA